jgi:hypothetical protein
MRTFAVRYVTLSNAYMGVRQKKAGKRMKAKRKFRALLTL